MKLNRTSSFFSNSCVLLGALWAFSGCGGSSLSGNVLSDVPISADSNTNTPDSLVSHDGQNTDLMAKADANGDGGSSQSDTSVEPGTFGAPCNSNSDCESGYCVEDANGYICTETCLDECSEGFACKGIQNATGDAVFLCIPDFSKLCKSCQTDAACNGGKCVEIGGSPACTAPCEEESDCPTGYTCTGIPDPENGVEFKGCWPDHGTCDCTPQQAGKKQPCQVTNDLSTCYGFRSCNDEGIWTDCDALPPILEECDGLDNDCNGVIDDALPETQTCVNSNEHGSCAGTETCFGTPGWLCSAPEPKAELCNYFDDNCDEQIDESFKNEAGHYANYDHCGACNVSCDIGFPNAVSTTCDTTKEPPQCVVEECEPGFYKLNGVQCIPVSAGLCQPCTADADCTVSDAKCITLGDGDFCSGPCTTANDCADGYICSDFDGDGFCIPFTNTCGCDGSNTNLVISCEVVSEPQGGGPQVVCAGTQNCTTNGWSDCQVPIEVCNEIDDNCNGVVDEGFKNDFGIYDSVGHCGNCTNNCASITYVNADPVCDTTTAVVPFCTYGCKVGFSDVDGNPANGCECSWDAAVDLPGDGSDTNCDGIDGEIDNAIFVAKNGSDSNQGTKNAPMLSIGAAVIKADQTNKRDVLVATGVYNESISMEEGVSIYGGYSGDFGVWNTTIYETVLFGNSNDPLSPGALNAIAINGAPTVFAGFRVIGENNNATGGSSYAIYVRASGTALTIRDNKVVGGNGGKGSSGTDGNVGGPGSNGAVGVNSEDIGTQNCNSTYWNYGGSKGSKMCGAASVNGGRGGHSRCPQYSPPDENDNENGQDGQNNTGFSGQGGSKGFDMEHEIGSCGTCKTPPNDLPWDAEDGTDGQDGVYGSSGGGASDGNGIVATDGLWWGLNGSVGAAGNPGGGGGGGGAGSGVHIKSCSSSSVGGDDLGGTGGGGGSGGCGGTGGQGGTGGGGSFGIFIYWPNTPGSIPNITGNSVEMGFAGDGGDGGNGGTGGLGGDGQNGGAEGAQGSNYWCARKGGRGGQGGDGGHGGGGGGGAGGVAAGIYVHGQGGQDIGSYTSTNNFITSGSGGDGGSGGSSLGNPGSGGVDGTAMNVNF
jgi:hypothetical protein